MTKVRWPLASITAVICTAALCFSLQSIGTIAAEDQAGKSDSAGDATSKPSSSADEDESSDDAPSNDKNKRSSSKKKKERKESAPKKKTTKSTRQPATSRGATGQRGGLNGGSAGGTSGNGRNTPADSGTGSSESTSSSPGDSSSNDAGSGKTRKAGSKNDPEEPAGGPDPKLVQKVIDIQNKYTRQIMDQKGLAGMATGLNEKGDVVIKVYTTGADNPRIPNTLDGIPVEVQVTGTLHPENGFAGSPQYDPKLRQARPVPIGVSSSPQDTSCAPSANCYSGTLGCRVKAKDGSGYFALSNNHVFANENMAQLGAAITQPSAGELSVLCQCIAEDQIGTLFRFKQLDLSGGVNRMDAAIVTVDPHVVGKATLPDGYGLPRTTTVKKAYLGQNVMKYGRTTGFTKGRIIAVNAFTVISYSAGPGIFVGQISYIGTGGLFTSGGDSGSLVVDSNRFPVALHFAGGSSIKFGSPIQPVLDEFGVEIDGDDAMDFDLPGKSGRTAPNSN